MSRAPRSPMPDGPPPARNCFGARLVRVGDGPLDAVTAIDARAEQEAERAGLAGAARRAIWSQIEALYRTGAYPAITFCLRRKGAIVFNRALGHAAGNGPEEPAGERTRLARPDTPICLFSASKAITALLVHKLAEEGGIALDAPVSRYLPAFTGGGKERTTIAQVLAHRGDFPFFGGGDHAPERLLDWDYCVARICDAPAGAVGRGVAYHAITGGFVLGEVIRRVTGAPLAAYLDSRFRRPLGMRYFTYGLDGRSRARAARNYRAGQPVRFPVTWIARRALSADFDDVVDISNTDIFTEAVIPSGNIYATAEEVSRFYQMLLDEGVYQGQRILRPETVRRAVRPVGRVAFDRTLTMPMRYSEAMMLGMDPFGLYGPMSGRAFGHLGFMNILGWADPDRDISAGLLVNGKAVLGGHLVQLVRTLSTIARRC